MILRSVRGRLRGTPSRPTMAQPRLPNFFFHTVPFCSSRRLLVSNWYRETPILNCADSVVPHPEFRRPRCPFLPISNSGARQRIPVNCRYNTPDRQNLPVPSANGLRNHETCCAVYKSVDTHSLFGTPDGHGTCRHLPGWLRWESRSFRSRRVSRQQFDKHGHIGIACAGVEYGSGARCARAARGEVACQTGDSRPGPNGLGPGPPGTSGTGSCSRAGPHAAAPGWF